MVEPQDPNRYQQMMHRQTEAVLAIAEMNKTLPSEFQEEAKVALDELTNFRAEINGDLDQLQACAATIKAKFGDKIHQEGLKRGFLMSELDSYTNCLNFDRTKLEALLQDDQDIWAVNLREANQRAKLAQERIQGFLEKQQSELLAFLKKNELTTISTKNELRRLPLWGIKDIRDSQVNFEWPKRADIENFAGKKVPPLNSISFWFKDHNTVCARGVQFEHVGGTKSPLFETGDVMNVAIKVDKKVIESANQVSACCRETQRDSIKSIAFHKDATLLGEINHYKREPGFVLPTYVIERGEEIIGGYGVSNRERFITSFGFILLRRRNF